NTWTSYVTTCAKVDAVLSRLDIALDLFPSWRAFIREAAQLGENSPTTKQFLERLDLFWALAQHLMTRVDLRTRARPRRRRLANDLAADAGETTYNDEAQKEVYRWIRYDSQASVGPVRVLSTGPLPASLTISRLRQTATLAAAESSSRPAGVAARSFLNRSQRTNGVDHDTGATSSAANRRRRRRQRRRRHQRDECEPADCAAVSSSTPMAREEPPPRAPLAVYDEDDEDEEIGNGVAGATALATPSAATAAAGIGRRRRAALTRASLQSHVADGVVACPVAVALPDVPAYTERICARSARGVSAMLGQLQKLIGQPLVCARQALSPGRGGPLDTPRPCRAGAAPCRTRRRLLAMQNDNEAAAVASQFSMESQLASEIGLPSLLPPLRDARGSVLVKRFFLEMVGPPTQPFRPNDKEKLMQDSLSALDLDIKNLLIITSSFLDQCGAQILQGANRTPAKSTTRCAGERVAPLSGIWGPYITTGRSWRCGISAKSIPFFSEHWRVLFGQLQAALLVRSISAALEVDAEQLRSLKSSAGEAAAESHEVSGFVYILKKDLEIAHSYERAPRPGRQLFMQMKKFFIRIIPKRKMSLPVLCHQGGLQRTRNSAHQKQARMWPGELSPGTWPWCVDKTLDKNFGLDRPKSRTASASSRGTESSIPGKHKLNGFIVRAAIQAICCFDDVFQHMQQLKRSAHVVARQDTFYGWPTPHGARRRRHLAADAACAPRAFGVSFEYNKRAGFASTPMKAAVPPLVSPFLRLPADHRLLCPGLVAPWSAANWLDKFRQTGVERTAISGAICVAIAAKPSSSAFQSQQTSRVTSAAAVRWRVPRGSVEGRGKKGKSGRGSEATAVARGACTCLDVPICSGGPVWRSSIVTWSDVGAIVSGVRSDFLGERRMRAIESLESARQESFLTSKRWIAPPARDGRAQRHGGQVPPLPAPPVEARGTRLGEWRPRCGLHGGERCWTTMASALVSVEGRSRPVQRAPESGPEADLIDEFEALTTASRLAPPPKALLFMELCDGDAGDLHQRLRPGLLGPAHDPRDIHWRLLHQRPVAYISRAEAHPPGRQICQRVFFDLLAGQAQTRRRSTLRPDLRPACGTGPGAYTENHPDHMALADANPDTHQQQQQQHYTPVGTLDTFLSPERIRGESPPREPPGDVWGLGAACDLSRRAAGLQDPLSQRLPGRKLSSTGRRQTAFLYWTALRIDPRPAASRAAQLMNHTFVPSTTVSHRVHQLTTAAITAAPQSPRSMLHTSSADGRRRSLKKWKPFLKRTARVAAGGGGQVGVGGRRSGSGAPANHQPVHKSHVHKSMSAKCESVGAAHQKRSRRVRVASSPAASSRIDSRCIF
uniref:Bromo domain-containing protein n=1 Tax=Macrostomum lignano TaxID=282301 RepID=A0A1I8JNQ1_9PLAT